MVKIIIVNMSIKNMAKNVKYILSHIIALCINHISEINKAKLSIIAFIKLGVFHIY